MDLMQHPKVLLVWYMVEIGYQCTCMCRLLPIPP